MYIPEYVRFCIDRLEAAGFCAYAVGGCVRDSLLGLSPHDYDLCTNALPEQTEAVFSDHRLILNGKKHGTVSVITDVDIVEITTFRTEGGYQDNRHPDWVKFVSDVEGDLARRDFTINAMAYSPTRGFADPFGGREDLKNHVLRAVGDPAARFSEDSLRILRGVRFSVKYALTPESATEQAMAALAPLMENLAKERIFDEMCKLLPLVTSEDLIRFSPVITQVIPELKPALGFDQKNPHHAYDLYTHIANVTEAVPGNITLRWAALLHDVAKTACFTLDEKGRGHFYGHDRESALMADAILRRLKAPTALREQVCLLIEKHMMQTQPTKACLRRRLSSLGPETLDQLLSLQEADMGSKGTGTDRSDDLFPRLRAIAAEIQAENACLTLKDLAVDGYDMMALGLEGPPVGHALNRLLELVLDEKVENTKDALLAAIRNEVL